MTNSSSMTNSQEVIKVLTFCKGLCELITSCIPIYLEDAKQLYERMRTAHKSGVDGKRLRDIFDSVIIDPLLQFDAEHLDNLFHFLKTVYFLWNFQQGNLLGDVSSIDDFLKALTSRRPQKGRSKICSVKYINQLKRDIPGLDFLKDWDSDFDKEKLPLLSQFITISGRMVLCADELLERKQLVMEQQHRSIFQFADANEKLRENIKKLFDPAALEKATTTVKEWEGQAETSATDPSEASSVMEAEPSLRKRGSEAQTNGSVENKSPPSKKKKNSNKNSNKSLFPVSKIFQSHIYFACPAKGCGLASNFSSDTQRCKDAESDGVQLLSPDICDRRAIDWTKRQTSKALNGKHGLSTMKNHVKNCPLYRAEACITMESDGHKLGGGPIPDKYLPPLYQDRRVRRSKPDQDILNMTDEEKRKHYQDHDKKKRKFVKKLLKALKENWTADLGTVLRKIGIEKDEIPINGDGFLYDPKRNEADQPVPTAI